MNCKGYQIAITVSFLTLVSSCGASLTQLPENVQAVAGDNVRIQCFTEDKNYPPSWSHTAVGSTQRNDVYLTIKPPGQDTIVGRMTEAYYGRFKVQEDRTTGEYSLLVTNVEPGDAGRYTCTARGGFGQQGSAELSVLEPDPRCATNVTEVLGENICNHDPDYIELSCSFRFSGNIPPVVTWVKTDRPGQVVRLSKAQLTDVSGEAVSKFVVRGDSDDLHGSSFTCLAASSNDDQESRLSCNTPVINVLKIFNLTESRTLDKPEEVHCNPPPHLPQTGCRWVKRKQGDEETETVVTNGRLLNLYRPEMDFGIYVCIVECSIRGQPCPVEALTITYEPDPSLSRSTSPPSNSTLILAVVLTVVITLAFTIVGVILYRKFVSKHRTEDASSNSSTTVNQSSFHYDERGQNNAAEITPLTVAGGDDDVGPHVGGDDGVVPHVTLDITDSTRLLAQPGDRELRNRRAEERANAKMRERAALRQNISPDDSTDGFDFAEGIGKTSESGKDE